MVPVSSDAFDKVARLLQIPIDPQRGPGAVLELYAGMNPLPPFHDNPLPDLPIPLSSPEKVGQLAFSFSGLLTSTQRLMSDLQQQARKDKGHDDDTEVGDANLRRVTEAMKREVARVFQDAAIKHVVQKVERCMRQSGLSYELGGLVVSGGVACNLTLRQRSV